MKKFLESLEDGMKLIEKFTNSSNLIKFSIFTAGTGYALSQGANMYMRNKEINHQQRQDRLNFYKEISSLRTDKDAKDYALEEGIKICNETPTDSIQNFKFNLAKEKAKTLKEIKKLLNDANIEETTKLKAISKVVNLLEKPLKKWDTNNLITFRDKDDDKEEFIEKDLKKNILGKLGEFYSNNYFSVTEKDYSYAPKCNIM